MACELQLHFLNKEKKHKACMDRDALRRRQRRTCGGIALPAAGHPPRRLEKFSTGASLLKIYYYLYVKINYCPQPQPSLCRRPFRPRSPDKGVSYGTGTRIQGLSHCLPVSCLRTGPWLQLPQQIAPAQTGTAVSRGRLPF